MPHHPAVSLCRLFIVSLSYCLTEHATHRIFCCITASVSPSQLLRCLTAGVNYSLSHCLTVSTSMPLTVSSGRSGWCHKYNGSMIPDGFGNSACGWPTFYSCVQNIQCVVDPLNAGLTLCDTSCATSHQLPLLSASSARAKIPVLTAYCLLPACTGCCEQCIVQCQGNITSVHCLLSVASLYWLL